MAATWDEIVTFALTLPEVSESTSWNTPSLKVKGRLFARLRTESDGALAIKCSPEDKESLAQNNDPAYYTTAHYDGHNYILVRLEQADREELFELLDEAWRLAAPPRVRAARES